MKIMSVRQHSGAQRIAAAIPGSRLRVSIQNFALRIGLGEFLMLIVIIVAGLVFYGSFVAIDNVLEVPVNQVEVKADLLYQTRNEITEVINGHIENGFIRVNLELLRLELLDLPWIYQVSIRRKLPHGLIVELMEQQPLAYWNDNAFVNGYGEVFTPQTLPVITGLPRFYGHNDQKVLGIYKELQQLLPKEQQPIRALTVSEQDTVVVKLAAGAELVLTAEKLHEQIVRWKQITVEGIGDRLSEVRQADLRYSNGAAVQWKNIVASREDKKPETMSNGK